MGSKAGRSCALSLCWVIFACLATPAAAHRLAPSLLEVTETAPGEIEIFWKTPLQRPTGTDIRPLLPEACVAQGAPEPGVEGTGATLRFRAACDGGLVGRSFAVNGLAESRTEALLRLQLRDGRKYRAVLRGGDEAFVVPERQGALSVFQQYLGLGFRHILSGFDHLLFVLGLVLLVTDRRMLIWTVTSFTGGHSVTLSLAALGFVGLSQGPVEFAIAVTILVLAVELARGGGRPSLLRRVPWAVAAGFGLLHGLGFAGALAEVGLPQEEIPMALFSFNVGIEVGQLVFVAAVLALRPAARVLAQRGPRWLTKVPAYAIGILAAFWCFDRLSGIF
ncbi:MAG: HupE/UreJ family protein [Deltaproteobacteria bacterium]|nr:HupE/UreJ family protein [Deltaproteobacteria bacterium]MBW2362622.1 HupE/UreJ family protein [Deltaproteobacteria bacterium]